MTGNLSANSVCNQVLKILKESNLNYLVNETPYSAYITIRKKFVKNCTEATLADKDLNHENLVQENVPQDKLEALLVENNILKDKLIVLESENKNLNIRLEITKGQLSNKNDAFEKAVKELEKKNEISAEKEAVVIKLKEVRTQLNNLEKVSKGKDDDLVMLEFTLKNRNSEIERYKNELDAVKTTPVIYNCEECEHSTETETDLKAHMVKFHELLCPQCNCTFAGKKKLDNHMCRIHVENPSSRWFYMKDWFIKDKCIRVFDDESKKEVLLLHSEDCIANNACTELPENFQKEISFKDTHGIYHLHSSTYMSLNIVNWEALFMKMSMMKIVDMSSIN